MLKMASEARLMPIPSMENVFEAPFEHPYRSADQFSGVNTTEHL